MLLFYFIQLIIKEKLRSILLYIEFFFKLTETQFFGTRVTQLIWPIGT